jgi:two-component system, sensor histidine kinase
MKKIDLNFALADPSHKPIFKHMISDPDRLTQVLINLLSNSLKFSRERSKIDISLRIKNIAAEKITFELCIQDYGLGIPEDKIDSLFIDFNSLDEHKKVNASGRGLGLSICRMIIDKMGGNVNVKSKVGVGSTFMITMDALYYCSSQS